MKKKAILLVTTLLFSTIVFSQFTYKIKADSVKITNDSCTAELILENSTRNVNGFLYNRGKGRTEFKRLVLKSGDSTYSTAGDTLDLTAYNAVNAWSINGNSGIDSSHFLGTTDSNLLAIKTNNQQRMSVFPDGTVNIAANDTTSYPAFRIYKNGDFAVNATNDYGYNRYDHKNGMRFNKKFGYLEIGLSNNIDTSRLSGDSATVNQLSGLIINSRNTNTFGGLITNSIVNGSSINIPIGGGVGWSIVSGASININGSIYAAPVIGESHTINGNVFKSFLNGFGHIINSTDCRESFINGTSNHVSYRMNSNLISGYLNSDIDSSFSTLVTGAYNSYSGNSQLIAGVNLISKNWAATTLGAANVDFASLTPVKVNPPASLKDYPLLAIGNSNSYATIRSNAFTMLYSGRTQINTTGYDATLSESDVTPKAALEIVSQNSGILIPKLTNTQRNSIISGDLIDGLLLYNTDSSKFQFYNGSVWKSLADGNSSSSSGITVNNTPVTSGTSGRIFFQNSLNQVTQSSGLTWDSTNAVLEASGSLTLSGTGQTSFVTPQSSSVPTKINIPLLDPGNFGQVVAMGVPAGSWASARVLSMLDGRTSSHQPTLAVFNPNESDAIGFSWDGSNTAGAIKTLGGGIIFRINTTDAVGIDANLNTGFGGNVAPTAKIHPAAGTASANTAPLKFTSGTNLTTPENGAVEYDGTNYFVTSGSTRYTLAKTLTATATLNFGSTTAQNSSDLTITITGATDGDAVSLGVPSAAVNAKSSYSAWVSSSNTVTVRFNNYSSASIDPASATFRVTITKY